MRSASGTRVGILLVGVGVLFSFVGPANLVSRAKGQIQRVPSVERILATDIGKRVLIVGRLGRPLGEVMTIKGEWSYPDVQRSAPVPGARDFGPKDRSLGLKINRVNNRPLDEPARFDGRWVSSWEPPERRKSMPKEGDVWEARCVEFGGYHGMPNEAYAEIYKPGSGPQAPFIFGFYTEIRYFSCRIVGRRQR